MDKSQLACVAVRALQHYEEEAKERQREAGKLYGENHPKREHVEKMPQPLEKSRDLAAASVGVGETIG